MTELAKDFFLQTHGDKGGSFDLLNSKESLIQNEKQQEKKVPQAQQQKVKVMSQVEPKKNHRRNCGHPNLPCKCEGSFNGQERSKVGGILRQNDTSQSSQIKSIEVYKFAKRHNTDNDLY